MFAWWRKHEDRIPRIRTEQAFDDLLALDAVLLFKHSPSCIVSWAAHAQVMNFLAQNPMLPVRLISVRADRRLSRYVAARLNVKHESPQVIVLRSGSVVSSASHEGVTAEYLARVISQPVGNPRSGIPAGAEWAGSPGEAGKGSGGALDSTE
jgi:bacillithiol system protein YtxJ